MQTVLGFLLIVLIGAFIVAMIKPRLVFRREMGRGKAAGILAAGIVTCMALGVAITPQQEKPGQQEQAAAKPAAPQPEQQRVPLDMTPQQILDAFNAAATDLDSPVRIVGSKSEEGPVARSTQAIINKHLGLVISQGLTESRATEATLICTGDGTTLSGQNILLGIYQFIAAFTPEATDQGRKAVLGDLGINDEQGLREKAVSVVGEVRFTLLKTEGMGIWLIAEHR